MIKAPSTLAAMMILAVFLCLGNSNTVWACSECICFSDATCSNLQACNQPDANCTRTVFIVDCDERYTFTTSTSCTGEGSCDKCQSCANLYKTDGTTETYIANCHTTNCGNGGCFYDCLALDSPLSSQATYVMYVCKVPCGQGTCESCPGSCTAYACLSYGVTTCTP